MASLLFRPNFPTCLQLDTSNHQPWHRDKALIYPCHRNGPRVSNARKTITTAAVQDLSTTVIKETVENITEISESPSYEAKGELSAVINESEQSITELSGFHKEHMLAEPEKDPRPLREIWREIQGCNDWEGLLDPLNSHLREELIRYGEFAQSSYDSFDFDPHSKYCGSCKYPIAEFFENMDMQHFGYRMCRYLYATSNINLEKFFQRSNSIRSIWSPHANWMGYVAVTSDEEEIKRLGRRDILIVWRGTVTYLEWLHDIKNILRPAHFRDNPHVQIESGFYDLYTTKEEDCKFCSFSAREQILAEVKRLVEKYKGEELSITITGHSLGGALALLSAYDIAEMRLNIVRDEQNNYTLKKIPVSVITYGSPRVGNLKFKERCDELGVKQLRVVNIHDKVPTMPGLIANEKNMFQKYLEDNVHFPWSYAHVGTEFALDHTHSPFLKPNADLSCAHNLEALLHLIDGYHGKGRKFRMVTKRDIALVNKDSNMLKSEYGVPPKWRQDHNKGMVRNSEGRWVMPERQRVEAHPPDTAHHFALAMKTAYDPLYDV